MQLILVQMALLIGCGIAWRALRPGGLDADTTRRALTGLVYYLWLPALVLEVMWRAPLGWNALRVAGSAAASVFIGMGCAWAAYRVGRTRASAAGALILAAAFANVTYLGLPVLEHSLGTWSRSVVIQYDLFACTPLLLTLGVMVARHYGTPAQTDGPVLRTLLQVPPLWAALAGGALNFTGIAIPAWVDGWLHILGTGVAPLMLISLGMALVWTRDYWRHLPLLGPVIIIRLVLVPVLVWGIAHAVGLEGDHLVATVLEAAMPSMVLGLVLCDRYHLDTSLYAAAVTVSTALSILTLPIWFHLLR